MKLVEYIIVAFERMIPFLILGTIVVVVVTEIEKHRQRKYQEQLKAQRTKHRKVHK